MGKLSYLLKSLKKQFTATRNTCQNCGSATSTLVDRKYLVTALRRCAGCGLLFRTPTDSPKDSFAFYNEDYDQGFTTAMPSPEQLKVLLETNFANTEKDYSYYISVMRKLGLSAGARVFDFGCSWGYGSYQLSKAGHEVISYEISRPRREYGVRNLGIEAVTDLETAVARWPGRFDCFFSAHVLEHVPSPSKVFGAALDLLKPGGIFLSFTPNGSRQHRANSSGWHHLWGEVHPNFIDDEFLDRHFSRSARVFGSSPVEPAFSTEIQNSATTPVRLPLDKYELVFAARKSGSAW